MSPATKAGRDLGRGVALACVLALLVAAAMWWVFSGVQGKKITAYFGSGVGVYAGGTVRMLGVEVGSIDSVEPQPQGVKVQMTLNRDVKLNQDPTAVVVLPSIVSDRYIQLPVYNGGPQAPANTVIPREKTRTPTEIDDAYRTLNKLATTLGPNGANKHGAVSDLLNTGAKNLEGNGQNIKDTLNQLGKAAETLNGNQGDLFSTVDNLQKFTTTLQRSDAQVRDFSGRLTDVSAFLNSERGSLAATVQALGQVLGKTKNFVHDNRAELKSNVDNLTQVTKTVADNRAPLAESLDVAPLALGNLTNVYNASSGTLDTRMSINELTDPPLVMACKLLRAGTSNGSAAKNPLADACDKLAPIVQGAVPLPSAANVIQALNTGDLSKLNMPPSALDTLTKASGGGK